MTKFWRKTLILNAKTPNYAPARFAQIITNFWRKILNLNSKTPKFAPSHDNGLKLWGVVADSIEIICKQEVKTVKYSDHKRWICIKYIWRKLNKPLKYRKNTFHLSMSGRRKRRRSEYRKEIEQTEIFLHFRCRKKTELEI